MSFPNYYGGDPDTTNKENESLNTLHGLSSFEGMKKTNWNHQQLLQFLSSSGTDHLKKPGKLSSYDSSAIFNKYARMGEYQNEGGRDLENSVSNPPFNNEPKFGVGSILTNSSLSASQPIDLPLQASSLETSKSAASKAIVALQEKIKVLEKENGYLREIVTKNEQNNLALENTK